MKKFIIISLTAFCMLLASFQLTFAAPLDDDERTDSVPGIVVSI